MKKKASKDSTVYDPSKIEAKWQKKWMTKKLYAAKEGSSQKKFYGLIEFPYPSGDGLHVGHPRPYIGMDVVSRKRRMQGYNVMYPIGWDAFGLPTENYAIKTCIQPAVVTKKNTDTFRRQIQSLGISFDWSREIDTTDPKYYRWTQWIFLQLLKHGLAYKKKMNINWCPKDLIGLANEEVVHGRCERCGTPVEKKEKEQWMLKITEYAERLLNDLDALDPDSLPRIVDKNNPHRKGKKTVERLTVHAIVKDPKTGKFLGLKWKKQPWTTFILGGVEPGEDIVEAARREVSEETGYTDLTLVKVGKTPVRAEYFAAHKDENRVAISTDVLFDLASDTRKKVSSEESEKHETVWLDIKDLNQETMTCSELPVFLADLDLKEELCFTATKGEDAVRPDQPVVERNAIMAVVKHWSEDKYIGLKWKKIDWQTLITGGPEGDQSAEDGAKMEIIEETGYLNPRLIRKIGKVNAKFFHGPKNVNRLAHFDCFYFKLENGDRQPISDNDKQNHEVVWLSPQEMYNFISAEAQKYIWAKFMADEKPIERPLLDWQERIKEGQRNWIGKSEGALVNFEIRNPKSEKNSKIEVFTTRPDTLFGVTYIVIAPEHSLVRELLKSVGNKLEVEAYIAKAKSESEIARTDATKEKTGVELKGIQGLNPANNEEVPIWIADYVLADYGTGAVMAVPAHDERDYEFAIKFRLKIKHVVAADRIYTSGPLTFKSDVPTTFRTCIRALVKHWSEDKYIVLHWKANSWKTLISGGVEKGEDMIDAAKREIEEETGFKSAEFVSYMGGPIRARFFAPHKDQMRDDRQQGLFFKLKDSSAIPIAEEEQQIHELKWVGLDELEKDTSGSLVDSLIVERFKTGNYSYTGDGTLINSGRFDGRDSATARKDMTRFVGGKWVTKFKLRDWIFSRQRYWGEPIPVVHCEKCGIVPLPEKELPLVLPKVKNYQPTSDGESPLAAITKWVNTKCPRCKGPARRETDTMPNWAGSSWYYLRYADPKNSKAFADHKKLKYWMPVDWYNGGMEHTTLHLLYSRFWHKFLFDQGLVPTVEPYTKRTSHGLVLAAGGAKMSKSRGNVINPDGIVKTFGADSLRLYEMFMGPFDQAIAWDSDSIVGVRRFIEKIWRLKEKIGRRSAESGDRGEIDSILHKAIKKVSDDIEGMRFNTAISTLMIAVNELEKALAISRDQYEIILGLLAPFAPHVAEELWAVVGNKKSVHLSKWPKFDPKLAIDNQVKIIVQVNGKVRGSFTARPDADKSDLEDAAKKIPDVSKWLNSKAIAKVIVVPGRLVNIVLTE